MASDNQAAPGGTNIPQAWTPEDIHYRVLLALPDARTIPVLALGVEAERPALDMRVIPSGETLSCLVGGNLSRSLQSRYGEHRLIGVRRRVDKRTAIYSTGSPFPRWLRLRRSLGITPDLACTGSRRGRRRNSRAPVNCWSGTWARDVST